MHNFDMANRSAFMRRPWAMVDTFAQVHENVDNDFDNMRFHAVTIKPLFHTWANT